MKKQGALREIRVIGIPKMEPGEVAAIKRMILDVSERLYKPRWPDERLIVSPTTWKHHKPEGAPVSRAICIGLGIPTGKDSVVRLKTWDAAMRIILPGCRVATQGEHKEAIRFTAPPERRQAPPSEPPLYVDAWTVADEPRRVRAWSPLAGWVFCLVRTVGPLGYGGR